MQSQVIAATSKRIRWTSDSVGYRIVSGGRRSYCYRFRDVDGVQRCFFLGPGSTEKQAKERLATVRVAKATGDDVRVSRELLPDFARRWLGQQTHLAPSTVTGYRWQLETFVCRCPHLRKPVSKVTVTDVAAFIAWMQRNREKTARRPHGEPLKGWTIRGAVSVLSSVLTEAVDQRLLASNPVQKVATRKREKVNDATAKRILTIDEIDALLAAAKARGLRWQALVALFVYAGLREGEALALTWGDVDLDAGVIRVRKQRDAKTGQLRDPKTKAGKRDIPVSSPLRRALIEWQLASHYTNPTDPVSSTVTGTAISHRNTLRAISDLAVGCGINVPADEETADRPNLDVHALRHVAGSAFVKATNGDIERVARWMGHADTKVLLTVYSHDFEEVRGGRKIEDDIAKLDAVFGS
jgi:integrase